MLTLSRVSPPRAKRGQASIPPGFINVTRNPKSVPVLPVLALFAASFALNAQDSVIAIRGARVFDGTGSPARPATVLIRGNRIEAIGADVAIPKGARIVDGTGQTLL